MKIKVALVDTGINASRLNNIQISKQYDFTDGKKQFANKMNDENGHGTICAKIISDGNPDIEFYDIKVLNDKRCGTVGNLQKALEFLVDTDVDIINMSLAFSDEKGGSQIKSVCEELFNKGKILVASMDNTGKTAYPACLESVIGVSGCDFNNKYIHRILDEKNIMVQADNTPVIYEWADKKITILGGTSKATAIISNQIIKMKNNKEDNIVQFLKKNTHDYYGEALEDLKKSEISYVNDSIKSDYQVIQNIIRIIPCQQIYKEKLHELKLYDPIFGLKTADYVEIIEKLIKLYNIHIDNIIPVMEIIDSIYSLEIFIKNGEMYVR